MEGRGQNALISWYQKHLLRLFQDSERWSGRRLIELGNRMHDEKEELGR